MKKTTCSNLRGACDTEFTGETPEEIIEACKAHVMEMIQAGDEAHLKAVQSMQELSPEEQQKFGDDFISNFDSLEEA